MLHVYLITFEEWYWFIAENVEEAELLFQEWLEKTFKDGPAYLEEATVQEPDENDLPVILEGTLREPTPWVLTRPGQEAIKKFQGEWGQEGTELLTRAQVKSCGQWAQERGKGFFATTGAA